MDQPPQKKAQAASEFMMTYGWAMLILLIIMGAFVYFGLLSPENFAPDQCMLAAGFGCSSYYATADPAATDPMKFSIINSLGQPLTGMTVAVEVEGTPLPAATSDCATTPSQLPNGASVSCGYQLPAGASTGDKVKGEVTIQWTDQHGNTRTRRGNLAVTVES